MDPNCVKTCATCKHDETGCPGGLVLEPCRSCKNWGKFEPKTAPVVAPAWGEGISYVTDAKGVRHALYGEVPVPVAVADGAGGAVKADTGKAPMSLIPRSALLAEADVLAFGTKKYAAHNWRKGMGWSRLIDAALRHLTAFADGEDVDPETGISHLAHLRCCAGFLIEYQQKGLGQDDRHNA